MDNLILLPDVIAAYQATEIHPMAGESYWIDEDQNYACPLYTLWKRSGAPGSHYLDWAAGRLGRSYSRGFIRGFDWATVNGRWLDDVTEFERGETNGKEIRSGIEAWLRESNLPPIKIL